MFQEVIVYCHIFSMLRKFWEIYTASLNFKSAHFEFSYLTDFKVCYPPTKEKHFYILIVTYKHCHYLSANNHLFKGNCDFNAMPATLWYAFTASRIHYNINVPFHMKHGRQTQILMTQKSLSVKFPINFNIFAHVQWFLVPKTVPKSIRTTKFLSQGLKETQEWKHPVY